MLSIENRIWDDERSPVSAAVRWDARSKPGEPADRFARAEVGLMMISKRHLFKDPFGFEMYFRP
jgi:hypothetical protein